MMVAGWEGAVCAAGAISAAPRLRGSAAQCVASRLRSSAASQLRFQQRGRHLARNIPKAEPYTESKSNPSGIQATFTEWDVCGSGPVLGIRRSTG